MHSKLLFFFLLNVTICIETLLPTLRFSTLFCISFVCSLLFSRFSYAFKWAQRLFRSVVKLITETKYTVLHWNERVNHIENMCVCVLLFGIFWYIWKSASIERYCYSCECGCCDMQLNATTNRSNLSENVLKFHTSPHYNVRKCIYCSPINSNRMQRIRCFLSPCPRLYLCLK